MVKTCIVCGFSQSSRVDLTFHRFPSDKNVSNLWCEALQLDRNKLRKYSYICSNHFHPENIVHLPGKTLIKKNVIPVLIMENVQNIELNTSTQSERDIGIEEGGMVNQSFSSSSTATAPEMLEAEATQHSDTKDRLDESFSTSTASEVGLEMEIIEGNVQPEEKFEDFFSTSTASEALMEIEQNEQQQGKVLGNPKVLSHRSGGAEDIENVSPLNETEFVMASTSYKRSNSMEFPPRKRIKKVHRYIGDWDSEDIECANNSKHFFRIAKQTIARQRMKIRSLQQKNRRLKSKVVSLQSLTKYLRTRNFISEQAESTLNASLTGSAKELFNRLQKKSSHKYSPELRQFALTLNFYSTKAYNYVRKTFLKSLPHTRTLAKWYQTIDGSPGFSQEALAALKLKVAAANSTDQKILCNLVFDEMSIRKRVESDGKKLYGYVDLGTDFETDNSDEAKEALVFMLVALNSHWKVPIGYFLLNGISGTEKANLVKNCLEFVHNSGVIVTSITFDGTSTNLSVANELGACMNPTKLRTSFLHPITNEKVFIFLDPSHMIKLIRNCLGCKKVLRVREILKKKIIYGKPIKWEFIERLCELQESEGLHAATKLRKRHILWTREKMKVKLAAQTLSKSVAEALDFLNFDLKLSDFKDSEATSHFCRTSNNLFDIFNSRNRLTKKPFEKPLSPATMQNYFSFMDSCVKYIKSLTVNFIPVLKSKRKTGFLGFLVCIESLKNLYQYRVVEKQQLKYVLTYKLSQDHLEIFFSCVRAKGGNNNNPTSRQFQNTMKRLLIHSEIKGSEKSNTIVLDSCSILHCSSSLLQPECDVDKELVQWEDQSDHEYIASNVWDLTLYAQDIIAYTAGFVVKKLKKTVKCIDCLNVLTTDEHLSLLQIRKTYGVMVKASQFVLSVCKEGEKCLRSVKHHSNLFSNKNLNNFLIIKTMKNLPANIFEYFNEHFFDEEPLSNHGYQLIKLILSKYFQIRCHHETSLIENTRDARVRSLLTKSILFKNQ